MKWRNNWPFRYALAVIAVALGALLRLALTAWVGPGLPTYITFYPSVMAAAVVAGIAPGLVATLLSAVISDFWLLEPAGIGVADPMEAVGLALFVVMGAAISLVAGRYRLLSRRLTALVDERTAQLHDANAALQQLNAELEQRVAAQTAELRRANETLEQRIADRTAEVLDANRELQNSRRAALNLMDDAIEARDRAEKASADLLRLQEQEKDAAARLARAQSAADTIRAMHEGVVLATLDGIVLSVNPAAEQLTGLAAGDLVGRNLGSVLPSLLFGADLREILESAGSVEAGPFPALPPVLLQPPGRRPVRVLPSVSLLGTAHENAPATVVLTVKDVTGLYEAEEKLRVTGTLLQLFISTTSRKEYLEAAVNLLRDWSGCRCVGIRVAEEQGFIPYHAFVGFSAEFMELENRLSIATDTCVCCRVAAGLSEPPDRAAMTPGGSFCCGDAPGFVGRLSEAEQTRYRGSCIKEGFASIAVVPIRRQDHLLGAIHLADERPDRVTRESVELLETMALMIGEAVHRFNVERDLRESEYRHRLLVEHVPAVTYTVVLHDRPETTYISPQIQSMLGLSAIDLEADPDLWMKQIHAGDRDRVLADLEAAIRDMRPFESEYRLIARDGREIWVHDSAVPIASEVGRPAFLQGVMYDITARRKAEDDRVRYEARLKSLAAALSATEEESRWRISRQIHDTVVQSLSLSNIKLGAIRREAETAGEADRLSKIDGVRALLNDAVHEARSLMTDLTPPLLYEMGLEPALQELVERLREEHRHAIEVEVEESLPDASHAVRGFLFASARELIMNALKHAHSQHIGVVLRAGVGELVLQVRDDGQGFESEPVRAVHDMSAGGFGLFSIRERAEGLGGKFGIEPATGKGTTITVTVPLRSGGEANPGRGDDP